MPRVLLYIICISFIHACNPSSQKDAVKESAADPNFDENPPAEGFNIEGSDPEAVAIADKVMEAIGGRKNWDNTKGLIWNFFGVRKLWWNKQSGDVRIESNRTDLKVIMNVNSMKGKIFVHGMEQTDPDTLEKYLDVGKNIWINDAYWLAMPFKLKDTGVTLTYQGEDTTQTGEMSYLLELSFKDVGVTPENMYEVWVSPETHFITQWAYYKDQKQTTPNFVMPWLDYKKYGNIYLSGNRGERKITEIEVVDEFAEHIFSEFNPAI